jgi:long-chain acyl-CoA synthetase
VVVPLSYSYGLVGQVLTTLHLGATLLLLGDLVFPTLQVDAMRALDARGLSTVPTSLRALARTLAERPAHDAPSLGYVASAGGPLDASTIAATRSAFPGARLYNQYGLTEASPRVAATDDREPAFARGSVGRPLDGTEVWAVCPDGSRAAPGVEGELVVRGPSVMLGYLGDPDETARVLSSDGALRTGDAGYVDDEGYIFVSGRCDGVVKCGGERVSVEEIAAVLRTHEGVRDACVIAVPHTELGATLHAFVEGSADVVAQLRRLVRSLPPAKRPARFTALAALPRTPNGKIARAELFALRERERESSRERDDDESRSESPR